MSLPTDLHSWFVPVFLFLSTITNVVVPTSGSAVVTPVLAAWTSDPLHAIALASLLFFVSGCIRAWMFREFIVMKYVKDLLWLSLLFSIIGTLVILPIPPSVLYVALFVSVFASLLRVIAKEFLKKDPKPQGRWAAAGVAALSGFLQGTGISGSSIRGAFLYGEGLNMQQNKGTGSLIGAAVFGVATLTRLFTHQFVWSDLWFVAYVVPIVLIATWIGKHIVLKIPHRVQRYLIVLILVLVLISVGVKLVPILYGTHP